MFIFGLNQYNKGRNTEKKYITLNTSIVIGTYIFLEISYFAQLTVIFRSVFDGCWGFPLHYIYAYLYVSTFVLKSFGRNFASTSEFISFACNYFMIKDYVGDNIF